MNTDKIQIVTAFRSVVPSSQSQTEKEIYLVDLEERIQEKRRFLLKKRKDLMKLQHTNEFLRDVLTDYHQYHNFILNEKKREDQAMRRLNEYVDNIMVTEKLTDEDIKSTRKEQNHILREISMIKKDLDDLVEK
jgi:hypothetical protein